jgi:thymidylate synthase (FAD)
MLDMDQNIIKVLDKGYVRLVNIMGTELDIVNSARVSFDKEVSSLSDSDISLINFLIKHKHDSTLRHCVMTFEVYAPLMIARQWWKHHISSSHVDSQNGWNESSRRYVTENEQFYIPLPGEWRSAPENSKQGSGEAVDSVTGAIMYMHLIKMVEQGQKYYEEALQLGVAPEQARLLLPAYGMYVRWRWTTSLNAALHFLSLRLGHGAQSEIVQYAEAVNSIVESKFPNATKAWNQYRI